MMNIYRTERGFARAVFEDRNGEACSIQDSSLATEACIWLGVNGPNPKVLRAGLGWVAAPLPEGTQCTTRMHLTQDQVRELLPVLQRFVDTGSIE